MSRKPNVEPKTGRAQRVQLDWLCRDQIVLAVRKMLVSLDQLDGLLA